MLLEEIRKLLGGSTIVSQDKDYDEGDDKHQVVEQQKSNQLLYWRIYHRAPGFVYRIGLYRSDLPANNHFHELCANPTRKSVRLFAPL